MPVSTCVQDPTTFANSDVVQTVIEQGIWQQKKTTTTKQTKTKQNNHWLLYFRYTVPISKLWWTSGCSVMSMSFFFLFFFFFWKVHHAAVKYQSFPNSEWEELKHHISHFTHDIVEVQKVCTYTHTHSHTHSLNYTLGHHWQNWIYVKGMAVLL